MDTDWKPANWLQIQMREALTWLAPIGTEGLLPGAAGKEQTPVETVLSSTGVGNRKYTAQMQVWERSRAFNRAHPDPAAQRWQAGRDEAVGRVSPYRRLDNLLDADKLDEARTEFAALVKDSHKPDDIKGRYLASRPFTGTLERDRAFVRTLTPEQLKVYQAALEERKRRKQAFAAMMRRPAARIAP